MGQPMATSQDFVNWVCDPDKLDHKFLKYVLLGEERSFLRFASGTTHQTVYFPEVKAFHVSLPPLWEQKAIARILGTLDDKIELNRRMNETLEAMAQALFKSWFVDFDPVIDKALTAGNPIPEPLHKRAAARKALGDSRKPLPSSIAQHFPSRFVFSEEMGWVPEGWEVKRLDEVASVIDPHPSHRAPESVECGFPFAGIGDIDEMGNINTSKARVIGEGAVLEQERSYSINQYSVGFGRVGTVGKVVRLRQQDFRYALSPTMAVINPLFDTYSELILYLMKSRGFQDQVQRNMTGSTRPAIGIQVFRSLKVVLPANNASRVLNDFRDRVQHWFTETDLNNKQNSPLTQLRDTLLPKLLSGELRIPEVDRLMEEAL